MSSERKKLLKKLNEIHWHSLLYICNDLWISPASDIIGKTEILKTEVTRKAMAESLLDWREHAVQEDAKFRWPHFTMIERPDPTATWAPPPALVIDADRDEHIELVDQDRRASMIELANAM
ncbi:hypothetical protein GYMLUDRAFT_242306, partial [Collybiopsis luxurians FD-317 M1]